MEPFQWFLLGVLVAWTPSMLVLMMMLHEVGISRDNVK